MVQPMTKPPPEQNQWISGKKDIFIDIKERRKIPLEVVSSSGEIKERYLSFFHFLKEIEG